MQKYLLAFQRHLDTKIKKIFFLLTGVVLGFIYISLISGRHTGGQGIIPNTSITLFQHEFHLHHWFMSPIYAAVIYLLFRKQKQYIWIMYFIIAFLLGEALQGFTYPDWYIVVK